MSNLFSKPSAAPLMQAAPTPIAPPVMPDPNSPAALEAGRQQAQQAAARGGRQSTILTTALARANPSSAYGGSKLGSG